ncbi:hypothetical protein [Halorubrum lipolyticum]|uniref:SpoVT-AbrB domain-containing protein n=1 Tax=Halorubrum lipolyticum DSM 21995 TaxID=1227482 RepID=M0P2C1_9EURY|nr:hypothetical protein [Halorubrum lipolyticum]EMA63679.1 hypothetical protein C469_02451 [Halorubrum lipolyticum DSM 21995]
MTLTKPSRVFASADANTLSLTLPAAVVSDSQFPFEADETIQVTIEGNSLRVSPAAPPADPERE